MASRVSCAIAIRSGLSEAIGIQGVVIMNRFRPASLAPKALILLLLFLSSHAFAQQPPPRIVISDPTGGSEVLNYSHPHPTLADCGGAPGTGGCRIFKLLYCSDGSCIERSSSGSEDLANSSPTGPVHAWAAAVSALEESQYTEIIMMSGGDSFEKVRWIDDNAEEFNIVAYVMVHGADYQTTVSLSDIAQLTDVRNVVVINSAGNGSMNGFFPFLTEEQKQELQNPDETFLEPGTIPYVPTGTFGMNQLAEDDRTLAVGAGFDPRTDPVCDHFNTDLRDIDLWCATNAPDLDANNQSLNDPNYFVAEACQGEYCGTSFAAPRVAAMVGELRYAYPTLNFDQVVSALRDRSAQSAECSNEGVIPLARGFQGREYSVPCLEDALAAAALLTAPAPEPDAFQFAVVPLNGFTLIPISSSD